MSHILHYSSPTTIVEKSQIQHEFTDISTHHQVIITANAQAFIVEPFYGGSHKQLIDFLVEYIPQCSLICLSAKKWHWRARCGALILSQLIPKVTTEKILFCSSVLNLCELLGLRPDLHRLKKIVYFHENQLVYPIREIKERDIQYAYNQIISCLSADVVLFNSEFNMKSFISNIRSIIKMFPDNRPKNLQAEIELKAKVLHYPIRFVEIVNNVERNNNVMSIVWPHRWEFDKCPEKLIRLLLKLKSNGVKFKVSLLGEVYQEVPEILLEAKDKLKDEIEHFGYLESKDDYFRVLARSHLSISTAIHEFFGVSMLESVHCGCFPLVPNTLVYPELYPAKCLYKNEDDLYEKVANYCTNTRLWSENVKTLNIDLHQYSTEHLLPKYKQLFEM